jgi:hypothetical protein
MGELTVTQSSREISTPINVRQKIENLQTELLKMPQADIQTIHTFAFGKYYRTIVVPPWVVLTGAAHKTDYKVRLEKGKIAVNVDDKIKILEAPCEFDAAAGAQRAGRVFEEEVVWTDVYENPDDCTDIDVLEDRLYVVPECGLGSNRPRLANESNQARQLVYEGDISWLDS